MPRFAANLSLLFTELAFEDRFSAAAASGFSAVEILFPYDVPADRLRRLLDDNGLALVLMNAPPPVKQGLRGFPAQTGESGAFRDAMRQVLDYARIVEPTLLHIMAGYEKGPAAQADFVENLRWLCDAAPDQGFAIEPLNSKDQPGYFLDDYGLAMDVIAAVGRPNLGLQYDTYHAQVIHGDAEKVWRDYSNSAVHVQIGAAPDRSEPGCGPMDFNALFAAFDQSGYAGWVSAEYHPSTTRTEETLGWKRLWTELGHDSQEDSTGDL